MTARDPSLVAWERWDVAQQAYAAAVARRDTSSPGTPRHRAAERDTEQAEVAWSASLASLYATTPRSTAGLLKLLDAFEAEESVDGLAGAAVSTICRAVRTLAQAGAWPALPDLGPGPRDVSGDRRPDRRDDRLRRRQRPSR